MRILTDYWKSTMLPMSGLMGGSSDSSSNSESTTTTSPDLTDQQLQAIQDAEDMYNNGGFYDPDYGGGETNGVADVNDHISGGNDSLGDFNDQWQDSMLDPAMDAAQENLQAWDPNNAQLQAQQENVINQTTNELLGNTMPTIDANAAASGGVGVVICVQDGCTSCNG